MPKVPTYDQPQVKSQGIPGVGVRTRGVSADAFGAIQGEQLQQAGRIGERIITEEMKLQEQRDVADGLDAATQLAEESRKKQQEFASRKGKDALTVKKEFGEWHQAKQQEIAGQIKSDRARQLFEKKAKQVFASDDDWAFNYQKQQDEVYYTAKIEASVTNATQSALYNPTPDNINTQLGEISGAYRDFALRKGYDADWIKSKVTGAEQKIHGDILQNAMQQDALGSVQSYLGQYGEKIDPGLRGKAEKWVHNKQIDETAGAYADSLLSSGVSYSEALAGAREKFSGEDEDKYVRRIKERYGEVEEQKRIKERDLMDALNKKLYQTGDITKVTDDDIEAFAEVNPSRAIDIKAQRDRALEVKAAGGEFAKESDIDTRQKVDQLILNGDLKDPRQLVMYRGSLDKNDYGAAEKLIEKQSLLDESGAKQAYKELLPEKMQKQGYVETEEDRLREAQFMKDAAAFIKDTHRPQDLKAFAADWNLKGKVQGSGWFGTNIGAKEMTQGEAAAAGVKITPEKPLARNVITQDYLDRRDRGTQKTIVRTGTVNGRKVVQYSDGSTEYAQ